jgi:ribonuclease HII
MTKKDSSHPENLAFEAKLSLDGYRYICGIDECGRGPFSGPVVACAVIMPEGFKITRLTDSKLIGKKEHNYFSDLVIGNAISYAIGVASVAEIDLINIKQASRLAMKRAVEGLETTPDYLLVDGNEVVDLNIPQKSIIKGDFRSHSISAAAIVAKCYRDRIMSGLDEEYGNVYGWAKNAGYQTKDHMEACYKHGLTKHHRTSWKTMDLFRIHNQ